MPKRVQRAGSDVAEHDAQRADGQGPHRLRAGRLCHARSVATERVKIPQNFRRVARKPLFRLKLRAMRSYVAGDSRCSAVHGGELAVVALARADESRDGVRARRRSCRRALPARTRDDVRIAKRAHLRLLLRATRLHAAHRRHSIRGHGIRARRRRHRDQHAGIAGARRDTRFPSRPGRTTAQFAARIAVARSAHAPGRDRGQCQQPAR